MTEDFDYCVPGPEGVEYYFKEGEFIALLIPESVVLTTPDCRHYYHKVYFRILKLVIDDIGFRHLLSNPRVKVEKDLTTEEKAYIYERLDGK